MSRIVTPENPLRAKAMRAASRIDSRVRSDLRATRGGEPSDAMRNWLLGGLGVEPTRPAAKCAEARGLRSGQRGRLEVQLVLPDPDVVGQSQFRRFQTRLETAGLSGVRCADPVAREDVRRGVIHRSRADRND